MQLIKLFAVLNLRQRLSEARDNWFPWLVIALGAATYAFTVTSTTAAVMKHQLEATRLEQVGTAWVLLGALWTALGAHLTKKDRVSLELMASQNALDVKEIVRIFKAASNFSTFGALMLILGTAVRLYKMYLH